MVESYYAAVYWIERIEPLESYARRAEALFQGLASCDPTLIRWFEQAESREAALKSQFTPDAQTLLRLLTKKKYQLSPAGWVSFAAWNGERTGSSVIKFSCGSDVSHVVDCSVLSPPPRGAAAERLLSAPVLSQVVRAMALAWEPEFGIATSDQHRSEVLKAGNVGTYVGWIMYFSKSRGAIPPLPAPVRVEPVEDKGSLIILTPERFTASNPEHVALAFHVQELLGQAGLLKAVQVFPWLQQ